MKKLLVIGSSGMIASRFIELAKNTFEIVGIDEKTLDITDGVSVLSYFDNHDYDAVINFAAYTNVDEAEKQKGDILGLCYKLNVQGVLNLISACNKKNVFLIQISTDFVFPGTDKFPGPYSEDSKLPESEDGIGWYGWTKNLAEKFVTGSSKSYAVVRFGFPFRADPYELKVDWARNLIKLYNEHKLYPLFSDQVQSLIFIDDLIDPLVKIISQNLNGIFHIASRNTVTPFEAGSYLLQKYSGKPVNIQQGSLSKFLAIPGKAPRPKFGGLKTEITGKRLGIKFKTWQEMVDEFIARLNT